ncbi:MAG TPA: glycosyltransferase family 2 protein [Nocardioides sp.]|nr:glycosyltransferase family 2 protein [Nocardioides sp.]
MRLFSRAPLLGVVIPAWGVEDYLDDCVSSLLAQTHRRWEAVIVDDGATDRTGEIADAWARRDRRISAVHSVNGGLGAARNLGLQHVRGDYVAFLDSDDVLPPTAYADLVGALTDSGSDFATGSIVRWEGDRLVEPPWMRRLHRPPLRGARIEERPELLGDVFAWNKVYRRSWWDARELSWPEGVRYEDQPTTTRAFLEGSVDVLGEVVYRWRIRQGSITQTRAASVQDLADRWATKRMSLASVREHGSAEVETVFVDRVLAGDLWRYFLLVPGCTPEWWRLLRSGVLELWGRRSLVHSGLPPVHRLAGWLVEQDRRADVTSLMEWVARLDGPAPRVQDVATGVWRLSVPHAVLDETTVDPAALALRDHEVT